MPRKQPTTTPSPAQPRAVRILDRAHEPDKEWFRDTAWQAGYQSLKRLSEAIENAAPGKSSGGAGLGRRLHKLEAKTNKTEMEAWYALTLAHTLGVSITDVLRHAGFDTQPYEARFTSTVPVVGITNAQGHVHKASSHHPELVPAPPNATDATRAVIVGGHKPAWLRRSLLYFDQTGPVSSYRDRFVHQLVLVRGGPSDEQETDLILGTLLPSASAVGCSLRRVSETDTDKPYEVDWVESIAPITWVCSRLAPSNPY